jgi:arylsulfatase A-like enzyme
MNIYAAFLAYTDHEIGRVIQAVEDLGELDDTLIIYISGDNGASAEGMVNGTPITYPEDESFDIGSDTRTGVAMLEHRYDVPFKFTGEINKLTYKLGPQVAAPEPKAEMKPIPAPEPDPIDTAKR